MRSRNELNAGVFLISGLCLFAFILWILGSERQIFSNQERFYATFNDTGGLAEGAPVRLGGIGVGQVAKIGFSNDLKDLRVHVEIAVSEKFLERIREDSIAVIQTQGLLGDKFLALEGGMSIKQLPPGSVITSREPSDPGKIFEKAQEIAERTSNVAKNIDDFLTQMNGNSASDIKVALNALSRLMSEAEKGQGLIHRLFFSKKDGDEAMAALSKASDAITEISIQAKKGKGLLGALLYGEGGPETVTAIRTAAQSFAETSDALRAIATEVKDGNGLANDLIYGESPSGLDTIVNNLNSTSENLKRVSESLARGEGTLGALLVDSQLYDNIVEVTDGAKRSFLLRQAIRGAKK